MVLFHFKEMASRLYLKILVYFLNYKLSYKRNFESQLGTLKGSTTKALSILLIFTGPLSCE